MLQFLCLFSGEEVSELKVDLVDFAIAADNLTPSVTKEQLKQYKNMKK